MQETGACSTPMIPYALDLRLPNIVDLSDRVKDRGDRGAAGRPVLNRPSVEVSLSVSPASPMSSPGSAVLAEVFIMR
jgi:hypothetical protein